MSAKAAAENAAYRAAHPDTNWEEINKHTGTAWKQDPGYQARQEFFPAPLSLRNSRVPRTTLTVRGNNRGINSTSFVRAQAQNNTTLSTRSRIFENKFMQRIITTIKGSIVENKPLDLNAYSIRLQAPDCSKDEAILLYDELIAIFIVLQLYVIFIVKENEKHPKVPIGEMLRDPNSNRRLFLTFSEIINLSPSAVPIGALLLIAPGVSQVTAAAVIAVGTLSAIAIIVSHHLKSGAEFHSKKSADSTEHASNLFTVIQILINTLFDNRNRYVIRDMREELKYFGLTKAQVDYLFTVDSPPEDLGAENSFFSAEGPAHNMNENHLRGKVNAYRDRLAQKAEQVAVSKQAYEDRQRLGHKVFGPGQIYRFIGLATVNKEELAPNLKFSTALLNLPPGAGHQGGRKRTYRIRPDRARSYKKRR